MTSERPTAFAAILGSLVVFGWILFHSVTGLSGATSAFVDPSCLAAPDCLQGITGAL